MFPRKRGWACPLGCPPFFSVYERGVCMIDAVSKLWSLMTVFFNTDVIYQPLFMSMLLMVTLFFVFYLVSDLLDISKWGGKF